MLSCYACVYGAFTFSATPPIWSLCFSKWYNMARFAISVHQILSFFPIFVRLFSVSLAVFWWWLFVVFLYLSVNIWSSYTSFAVHIRFLRCHIMYALLFSSFFFSIFIFIFIFLFFLCCTRTTRFFMHVLSHISFSICVWVRLQNAYTLDVCNFSDRYSKWHLYTTSSYRGHNTYLFCEM